MEVGVREGKENSNNNNNKTVKQLIVENFPKLMQDNKLQIQETQRTLSWRKKKIMQKVEGRQNILYLAFLILFFIKWDQPKHFLCPSAKSWIV